MLDVCLYVDDLLLSHADINVLKREIKEIVKVFHGFNVIYDNELIK